MKRIAYFAVIITAMLGANVAISAQVDKRIADVQRKVAAINKNAARYTKTKRDVLGASTEGGEASYFHKGKELKKITAKIYGETYNAVAELYFETGQPVFYYFKLNRYDTQIGLSKPVKIVKVEEERYYFAGAEMIKVMFGKKVIKETDEKYAEMRDGILKLSDDLRMAYDEPT